MTCVGLVLLAPSRDSRSFSFWRLSDLFLWLPVFDPSFFLYSGERDFSLHAAVCCNSFVGLFREKNFGRVFCSWLVIVHFDS